MVSISFFGFFKKLVVKPHPRFAVRSDLPPVSVSSFKFEWGSSQARDGLPKGKRKPWIRKLPELGKPESSQEYQLIIDMILIRKGGLVGGPVWKNSKINQVREY
jgi:hypothetical protein